MITIILLLTLEIIHATVTSLRSNCLTRSSTVPPLSIELSKLSVLLASGSVCISNALKVVRLRTQAFIRHGNKVYLSFVGHIVV